MDRIEAIGVSIHRQELVARCQQAADALEAKGIGTCSTCRWWTGPTAGNINNGECRGATPVVDREGYARREACWPLTRRDHWCGAYARRAAKEGA